MVKMFWVHVNKGKTELFKSLGWGGISVRPSCGISWNLKYFTRFLLTTKQYATGVSSNVREVTNHSQYKWINVSLRRSISQLHFQQQNIYCS